jgi:translocation and assembly module TamA
MYGDRVPERRVQRGLRRALRCLTALCVLFVGMAAQPLLSQELLRFDVRGINGEARRNVVAFLGANPETEAARRSVVAIADTQVREALQAVGYYNPTVAIAVDRARTPWIMTVDVALGEAMRYETIDVRLLGDASQDEAFQQFLESRQPKPRQRVHHGTYERFRDDLLALGQQRGYVDAKLELARVEVNASSNTARLRLHYHSGRRMRFGAVHFDAKHVDPAVLQAMVPFESGEPFDVERLQYLQGRLQQTGYFSGVLLVPGRDGAADGELNIDAKLSPARRHSYEIGLGFDSDTRERVSAVWRTPVVNRRGHAQETRIEYSRINPRGSFTYRMPLSDPITDNLLWRLRLEDNEFGAFSSLQQEALVRREQRPGPWIRNVSLRILREQWSPESLSRSVAYLLPGISWSRTQREGSLLDPTGGFSQLYRFEAASATLGSDINLARAYASWRFIRTLAERHRVVARAELGAVHIDDADLDRLAPSLGFFAGGAQSIRGFSYQSLGPRIPVLSKAGSTVPLVVGGNRLAVASLEHQYYWTPQWRSAVFFDAGDAFFKGSYSPEYAAGLGIHYISPVGPIRLEFARSLSGDSPSWRLVFNLGAEL